MRPQGAWLSEKVEMRQRSLYGDKGIFTRSLIKKGELLVAWGGYVVERESLAEIPHRACSLQIEDNLFLIPETLSPADYVNHSCEPNAGLSGQVILIALRDILPDEEICYDYAMSDGCDYDEFDCLCGSCSCRKRIRGNDWSIPELWERYANYFSPYLQRRIDRLRAIT